MHRTDFVFIQNTQLLIVILILAVAFGLGGLMIGFGILGI